MPKSKEGINDCNWRSYSEINSAAPGNYAHRNNSASNENPLQSLMQLSHTQLHQKPAAL